MNKSLLMGFHIIAFAKFSFAVYYDYMYTIIPDGVNKTHSGYGGKFKFLTFWDAVSINLSISSLFIKNILNKDPLPPFFRKSISTLIQFAA